MSMTGASMFWHDTLHDCNLDRPLPLPFDRSRRNDETRTDRGTSVSFNFGEDLSHHFFFFSSSMNIDVKYLAFATYYAFLFKLTNGEKDLCVTINTDSRFRDELKTLIGLFDNVIPLRCQLDPRWSFHQLLKHVCEMITSTMNYSYFPLQHIIDQHQNVSKLAFLDIFFDFQSSESEKNRNEVMIGDTKLFAIPSSIQSNPDTVVNKFDFSLAIQHDTNINQLSCTINASLDLFNVETVDKIAQRFHLVLKQLFTTINDQMKKPIYELSLILSDENRLMKSINNTQVSCPFTSCIHHEFVCQVMKNSQKLAVELDDQSLTYSELLLYVQQLAIHLLDQYGVVPGDIIAHCVNRSLSLVS